MQYNRIPGRNIYFGKAGYHAKKKKDTIKAEFSKITAIKKAISFNRGKQMASDSIKKQQKNVPAMRPDQIKLVIRNILLICVKNHVHSESRMKFFSL